MNLLTETYRPKTISQFVGNERAVASTKRFLMAWMKGKQKKNAILYHGPPGIGKTTLAQILAKDSKLEFTHLNASDLSRKDDIEPLFHNFQLSFDDKLRIILIDEADRIPRRTQQSGLIRAVQGTSHPVVVVVNDLTKLTPALKKVCLVVPFQPVPEYLLRKLLLTVAQKEGIKIPGNVVSAILKYGKTPRDILNLLEDYRLTKIVPTRAPVKELTDKQKMEMILRGDEVEMDDVETALVWFGDSELEDFRLLADTGMVNRINQFYAKKMLKQIRGPRLTGYPYSFRFKGMANQGNVPKKKKEKPKVVRPKVVEKKEVDLMEWI